jgi:hypothetical protein
VNARRGGAGEPEQQRHLAVGDRRVPLFVEPDIGLHQGDRADGPQRKRPFSPRAIPPGEEHRDRHRKQSLDVATHPHFTLSRDGRCEHHVAPHQPQRHSTRPSDVSPLNQHPPIGKRRPEPEPGKRDVAEMADRPFQRGPEERKHQGQRQAGIGAAQAGDEPEQPTREDAEEVDGDSIAEGCEGGKVPQRHDHPVEHERVREEPIAESPAPRGARVGFRVQQQEHRRHERDETENRQGKRRIASREREGAERDQ